MDQQFSLFRKINRPFFLKQKLIFIFSLAGLIVLGLACGIPIRNPQEPRIPPLSTADKLFPRQSARINAVVFDPAGRWLVTAGADRTITMWDFSTATVVREMPTQEREITSLAFSPGGKILVSGSMDTTLAIWNPRTGQELKTLSGHSAEIKSVAFSPDGKIIASGSADHTIKLWDAASGQELRTLSGHTDSVNAIGFSPDGVTLASASSDSTVKLWRFASGELIRTLPSQHAPVLAVAFSMDGNSLAAGTGFSVSGFAAGLNRTRSGDFAIFDVRTGLANFPLEYMSPAITALAFSPDARTLAVAYIGADGISDIADIDLRWRELRQHFHAHARTVNGLAFSPDGEWLVSVGSDKAIRGWH